MFECEYVKYFNYLYVIWLRLWILTFVSTFETQVYVWGSPNIHQNRFGRDFLLEKKPEDESRRHEHSHLEWALHNPPTTCQKSELTSEQRESSQLKSHPELFPLSYRLAHERIWLAFWKAQFRLPNIWCKVRICCVHPLPSKSLSFKSDYSYSIQSTFIRIGANLHRKVRTKRKRID